MSGNKKFSRRNFIKLAGVVLIGATGLGAIISGARQSFGSLFNSTKALAEHYLPLSEFDAFNIRQLITADSMTTRMVMWQSGISEATAVLEYRLQGTEKPIELKANEIKFTDYNNTSYLHSAMLQGLLPQKSYEYRVGCADKRSDWHSLKTASQGKFKALIFADSQSSDYSDWRKLAKTAYEANQDANFFVNMGDLVDNGEDPSQWKAWFNSVAGMIANIPCAPVLGNHETYNMDWKVRMPTAYLNLFNLPDNGSKEYHNQYYSFDYGSVHFVVLNTQNDEMGDFQADGLNAQLQWLESDLQGNNKQWKIVLMHKDVLTYEIKNRSNRHAGISDVGKLFMPLFDKYNIDVVLTAHLHTYRRRDQIYNFQPAKQGPLYIITGVAGNVRYADFWLKHPWDKFIAPQPETNNYMTLEADHDSLRLSAFLPNGDKFDEVELKK